MNPLFANGNLGTISTIYFAHNGVSGYDGNLFAVASNMSGVGGNPIFTGTTGVDAADYLCNTDESKPNLPSGTIFKAIITGPSECQACDSGNDNCTIASGNNIGWVMNPNTNYINTNNNIIGTTNGAGVFTFNTSGLMGVIPTGFTGAMAWTWLTDTWLNADYASCNSWTSQNPNVLGSLGLVGSDLGAFQISSQMNTDLCNVAQSSGSINGLYCVQQ